MRDYHKLDFIPSWHLEVYSLSELTGVPEEVLKSLTFSSLIEKFYDHEDYHMNKGKLTIHRDVDIVHRRFCPMCLKEYRAYKLLWQVKDIRICTIHKVELITECSNCGRAQPYASKTLADFLCNWCGYDFSTHHTTSNFEPDVFKEQVVLQNMWESLQQNNVQFIQKISGKSLTKSFIIKLLYIASGQAETWDRYNLSGLSGGRANAYLHYLNDGEAGYPAKISNLLHVLSFHGITTQTLSAISVPKSFYSSNITTLSKQQLGMCCAPWCKFYESNKGMKRILRFSNGTPSVSNRLYHYSGKIRFTFPHVCDGCFMEYGYDPTLKWMVLRRDIELVNIIRRCLIKGLSYIYISKKYAIGMSTIQRLVGYCVANGLLPQHLNAKLKPPSLSDEELMWHFRCIHLHGTKINSKSSWDLFGWTRTQFYYYRSLDVIQRWYLFGEADQKICNKEKKTIAPTDIFMDRLITEIENMKQLYVPITVKELTRRLDSSFLSSLTVKSAPYLALIKKEIELQKDVLQKHMMQQWWEQTKIFVAGRLVVYVKDVYDYLGVTESTVRRNCPDLHDWISNTAKYSRKLQLQQTVDECLVRIELATDTLISQNKSTSIQEILRIAEVPSYIGYYYPDLVKALNNAKNRIHLNIELRKENDLK